MQAFTGPGNDTLPAFGRQAIGHVGAGKPQTGNDSYCSQNIKHPWAKRGIEKNSRVLPALTI
jgi:hypothetical protein